MRTFDKKDIFTIVNAEEAKKYIGQQGYFTSFYSDNLSDWDFDILKSINDLKSSECNSIFNAKNNDYICYGLFLPMNKVKEIRKETKWRPFTLEEFNETIPMGTVFKYKYKRNNVNDVYSVYYHANLDCENGFQSIFFEDSYHDFVYCFNEMKLFLNGEWQPFGVLDDA